MASNKGNTKAFATIIYPENPEHIKVLEEAEKSLDEYVYILHNMDINKETGEILKPHYHLLWRYPEQRSIKTVAEEIELPENMIEKIHNYSNSLVYLIHAKNADKYQYSEEEVKGSAMGIVAFKRAIRQFRNKTTEEDTRIMGIVNMITEWHGIIRYKELITECCTRGWYSDLRRSSYLIQKLVFEHNEALEAHTKK